MCMNTGKSSFDVSWRQEGMASVRQGLTTAVLSGFPCLFCSVIAQNGQYCSKHWHWDSLNDGCSKTRGPLGKVNVDLQTRILYSAIVHCFILIGFIIENCDGLDVLARCDQHWDADCWLDAIGIGQWVMIQPDWLLAWWNNFDWLAPRWNLVIWTAALSFEITGYALDVLVVGWLDTILMG